MRVCIDNYIHDTGVRIWGGDIVEGLSKSSLLCPGHNTIASYLDKRLPAKARKAVEDHMASCKECRLEIFELRKIMAQTDMYEEAEETYGY